MNIFLPQSIQTQIELEEIADVKRQLITPATSTTIIGIVQDGLLGSYNLTFPNMRIDWRNAMNIMSYTSLDDFESFKKDKEYTGHELFSLIIPPKINVNRSGLEIENGVLKKGHLSKEFLGSKKNNALHQLIWDEYGVEETKTFLDNTQRLINNFNLYQGFTIGIGDMYVAPHLETQVHNIFQTKELKVTDMITNQENNPELIGEELFENQIFNELNNIREDVSKLLKDNLDATNNLNIIVSSGAKGTALNIGQMSGCVGMQAFEGKLIPKKINKRTLPYYFQNDDRAESRGLIKNSYQVGTKYTEFFYHNMTARQGIIDQAIKSVTGDTPVIVLEDGHTKNVNIGDWIDKYLLDNKEKVEHYTEREMELLKLNKPVYIPTTDESGNVTWGLITAITRHDPGKELYEIKTRGGKQVIVTESKSLLIWNANTEKFERMSTPDVVVGDFVPVTMKLATPPTIHDHVKVNDTYEFKLNQENGVLIGELLAKGKNTSIIPIEFLETFMGYGTKEMFVPNEAFTAPDEFVVGLLSGYMKTQMDVNILDGIIYVYPETKLVNGLNMLLTRIGVFGRVEITDDITYRIVISGQWAGIFANKITIKKPYHRELDFMVISNKDEYYKEQNDVILDEITEINKIDVAKYPKVYDLTVPSTLNFGLANGLHVVDTAESGYIQRKLVKSMEDAMIKYDCTVRSASNAILQFVYGDTGADTTKQYVYTIGIIEMGDAEIATKYKIKDEDLSKSKITKKENDAYYNFILEMRDLLRVTQIKSRMNYITPSSKFMLPINLSSIVENNRKDKKLRDTKTDNDNKFNAQYILEKLDSILNNANTTLMCIHESDINNKSSMKYQDDQTAKTSLKIALHDLLAPARCLYEYKLSKTQFDEIMNQISKNFNKNIAEAGEMVGAISAQSMGEPVTQMNLNAFHSSGIAAISHTTQGVPRIMELLSLRKKLKTPQMVICLKKEHKENRIMATKINSYIQFTTLNHIRKQVMVYYDPIPLMKDGHMDKDNVTRAYYSHNVTKNSCQGDVTALPWLIRIELDREKMLDKEVTLLEIKSKFCNSWEKRYSDSKNMRKEERNILDKITQISVLSNTDNDDQPVLHIRFEMTEYEISIVNDFIDYIIDPFKLKGIPAIIAGDIIYERVVTYDNPNHDVEKKQQYNIYTAGVNLFDIRYVAGIDIYNTICNDVLAMYETFGIESARATLAREIIYAFERDGSSVNYHHLSVLVDLMTSSGNLISIDRHGMNKSDTDPLSRASFEKTVEQLLNAAVFSEVDHMKGVSSRIMTGLVIKGGTGLCDLILDTEMLEKSEYTEDIGQKYEKTFIPIIENTINEHIVKEKETEAEGIFVPL